MVVDEGMAIYVIESLKLAFSKAFNDCCCFELDSSGIQLLLALKKELALRRKVFRLTAISSEVKKNP